MGNLGVASLLHAGLRCRRPVAVATAAAVGAGGGAAAESLAWLVPGGDPGFRFFIGRAVRPPTAFFV